MNDQWMTPIQIEKWKFQNNSKARGEIQIVSHKSSIENIRMVHRDFEWKCCSRYHSWVFLSLIFVNLLLSCCRCDIFVLKISSSLRRSLLVDWDSFGLTFFAGVLEYHGTRLQWSSITNAGPSSLPSVHSLRLICHFPSKWAVCEIGIPPSPFEIYLTFFEIFELLRWVMI